MNETYANIGFTVKFGRNLLLTFVTILGLLAGTRPLHAANVTLGWNPSANVFTSGYLIASSTDGTNFDTSVDVGTNTIITLTNLNAGVTYYFEVISYGNSFTNYGAFYTNAGPLSIYTNLSASSPMITYSVTNTVESVNPNNPTNQTTTPTNSEASYGVTNPGAPVSSNSAPVVPPVIGKTVVTNAATGFALLVNGNGSIGPSRKLNPLLQGDIYTLTATAAKGAIFTAWTSNGVVISTSPSLTFEVLPYMLLQANFEANPLAPAAGSYHGLFYDTNAVSEISSGSFAATVNSTGEYTAKLVQGSQTHPFSGQFNAEGTATATIKRPGQTALAVTLQMHVDGGVMTGTVSDGAWVATLAAEPAVYARTNPAPQAGKYTLAIAGGNAVSNQPAGYGFATVTVSPLGGVSVSGTLADGTVFSASSTVAADGQWPLYASLNASKTAILGWLSFTNDSIAGQVSWIKLPQASAKYYPAGFTNTAEVIGSSYNETNGVSLLNLTDGLMTLANGGFAQAVTNQVTSPDINTFTDANGDKLTFKATTGAFKGSFTDPVTGKPVAMNGVVLQNQNIAAGYFLDNSTSGSVMLASQE